MTASVRRKLPFEPLALVAAAGALTAMSLVSPGRAWSCDCSIPRTAPEAVALAASVFSGEVIAVEDVGSRRLARLEVESVWKGPIAAVLEVLTAQNEAICGFTFRPGARYIIYAQFLGESEPLCELPGPSLETSLCTRNQLYNAEEASALGPPLWKAPPRAFLRGDADGSGALELTDMVRILVFLFQGGPPAPCEDAMDTNDDAAIDLSDAVFGLSYLFSGGPAPPEPGPRAPGFDPTTTDPFDCGDASQVACKVASTSTLPGVRLEMVEAPCVLTLEEAARGVVFAFRIVVEDEIAGVTSRDLGSCHRPGLAGLYLLPRISGGDQLYCLCDLGLCPVGEVDVDLVPGSYAETFKWCGRNWTGPSDFQNPIGAPFPPGRYRFEVRGEGTGGPDARPWEVAVSYELELVP